MGGSRRRLKKNAPKVRVGLLKRKKNEKAKRPVELTEGNPALLARLKQQVDWQEEDTLNHNYQKNLLVVNPNEGFGRNQRQLPLKSKEERQLQQAETYSDDDELRAACNLERKTGKALPMRLTNHQRAVMQRLIETHKDDVEAMFRDIKLNTMQHSAGKLKQMMEAYHFWDPSTSRHDFRAPRKEPKRIY